VSQADKGRRNSQLSSISTCLSFHREEKWGSNTERDDQGARQVKAQCGCTGGKGKAGSKHRCQPFSVSSSDYDSNWSGDVRWGESARLHGANTRSSIFWGTQKGTGASYLQVEKKKNSRCRLLPPHQPVEPEERTCNTGISFLHATQRPHL